MAWMNIKAIFSGYRFRFIQMQHWESVPLPNKLVNHGIHNVADNGSLISLQENWRNDSYLIILFVPEPETEIMGGPDLFIYAGSTINLTCIVRHTPEPPNSINWTHRGKVSESKSRSTWLHNSNKELYLEESFHELFYTSTRIHLKQIRLCKATLIYQFKFV